MADVEFHRDAIKFYGKNVMAKWAAAGFGGQSNDDGAVGDAQIGQIREALDRAKTRALAWMPTAGPDPSWQMVVAAVVGLYENAIHELECDGCAVKAGPVEIEVNKLTHSVRFADETELWVRVIIEPNTCGGSELTAAEWKAIVEDPDLEDQYHG
jgi:hypothetical protein